nr:hypothetical protein [Hyphomonas sp. UBA2691]
MFYEFFKVSNVGVSGQFRGKFESATRQEEFSDPVLSDQPDYLIYFGLNDMVIKAH